ncbi:asparaginyl-tRNA synthetase-like [Lineus longissimus]|uniref:asparaginyl-tRNA synthetase-like n=1 Tax=Lineus longissimus TaxID=88925 RepID=UPI00315D33A1
MRHPPDFIRKHQHLRPRTNIFSSLLRIRNTASQALHQYFQENGFCEVHTPIITTNDCEGAGEVFGVEPLDRSLVNDLDSAETDEMSSDDEGDKLKHFFKNPAFLTVSGQLHLETVNGGFSKVYTFGPTFRAENSLTRNHLSEFYMLEAEIAFIYQLEDLMVIMEDLIKKTTETILARSAEDVNLFFKHVSPKKKELVKKMLKSPFMRISYTDAVELLQNKVQKFQFKPEWGEDLKKEHERFLTHYFGDIPVFVTEFPARIKPFYAKLNDDNCNTAAAVDLLFPEVGEVFGGSLREDNFETLEKRLQLLGLVEGYQWYLDLRRFGSAPHGGFGMGFERYLQYLLGVSNIRDVIPFPRWPKHCHM